MADGENDFIALEDLSAQSYVHFKKENEMDYESVLFIIRLFARFHALSFAFKDQFPKEFEELANNIEVCGPSRRILCNLNLIIFYEIISLYSKIYFKCFGHSSLVQPYEGNIFQQKFQVWYQSYMLSFEPDILLLNLRYVIFYESCASVKVYFSSLDSYI